MLECRICVFSYDESEFHFLKCCNQNICLKCLDCLTVPLCPYCRTTIDELKNNKIYKQGYSYDDSLNDYTITQIIQQNDNSLTRRQQAYSHPQPNTFFQYIDPYDPNLIDSRLLRRKIRKYRKIRERDRSRSSRMREINEIINEDLDLFLFEI